ncbi:MAG: LysR family transcriptional regulator [Bdellovibrionota bacterium]|nr:LysR family transcriptional regulator [Bdellovibrionota bacterium]
MLLDQVNLNQLRVFQEVFKTNSMTMAAKNLHLTQSGVSQHIRSLEETLDVQLFDRINQRLIPTNKGKELYTNISRGLSGIEDALWGLKDDKQNLKGTVTIGMPIEFGNNEIIPLLCEFSKNFPFIKYRLYLDFAEVFNQKLLNGDIDFAFVDQFKMDRRIYLEQIYSENLELCISPELLKDKKIKNEKKFYESLPYVEYQQGQPVLGRWFEQHLGNKNLNLDVKATVMDVQGLSKFITRGMGAGILPHHLYDKLITRGHDVIRFEGSGKPLVNEISLAYIENRSFDTSSSTLLNWLVDRLKQSSKK